MCGWVGGCVCVCVCVCVSVCLSVSVSASASAAVSVSVSLSLHTLGPPEGAAPKGARVPCLASVGAPTVFVGIAMDGPWAQCCT